MHGASEVMLWQRGAAAVLAAQFLVVALVLGVAGASDLSDTGAGADAATYGYDERLHTATGSGTAGTGKTPTIGTNEGEAHAASGDVGHHYDDGADLAAPSGAGDDLVDLYRAPQPGQATGPLDPADFPGSFANGYPDGRSYWTPNRELADEFTGAYGTDVISVSIPRGGYDAMLDVTKHAPGAGEFPYPGPGGFVEVAIPRWLVPSLNKFGPR